MLRDINKTLSSIIKKLSGLYDKPELVGGIILVTVVTTLVVNIVTREEPYVPPEPEPWQPAADLPLPEDDPDVLSAVAAKIDLSFPLACTLGTDCWVARYMDREAGPAAADFTCGTSTQDAHKGTDLVIADLGRMAEGVPVLAAAPGTVLRLRDGMDDVSVKDATMESVDGKECGNAVIIEHENGWQTQYCHLRKGSLKVKQGDTVGAGDTIGDVGLSGMTEYPHLHFMVRHDKTVIDPFDGGPFQTDCNDDGQELWKPSVSYSSFALLPVQFSAEPQTRENVWNKAPASLASNSPALILTARGFHVRRGDGWHFKITDPDGEMVLDKKIYIEDNKQFAFRYIGIEMPEEGFKPGIWTGTVHVDHGPWDDYEQTIQIEVTP